jgi:hypothetical protein
MSGPVTALFKSPFVRQAGEVKCILSKQKQSMHEENHGLFPGDNGVPGTET